MSKKGKKKPAIPKLDMGAVTDHSDSSTNGSIDYSKSSPRHSIFLLVPAFTFPEPLSTEALKERCRETLGYNQLEFFALSSLGDDSPKEKSRVIVTGCKIMNDDFTLESIEKTLQQNQVLREEFQRAAEALITFEEKNQHNLATINALKEQIHKLENTVGQMGKWEEEKQRHCSALEDEIEELKKVLASYQVPRPQESLTTACIEGEKEADHSLATTPTPHATTTTNSVQSTISLLSPRPDPASLPHKRPTTTIRTNSGLPERTFSSLTSPDRQKRLAACRLCNCGCFLAQPTASWVCMCGHMSVKHAKDT